MKYVCLNSDFNHSIVEISLLDDDTIKKYNYPVLFASDDEQRITDFLTFIRMGYHSLGIIVLPGGTDDDDDDE